jgi:hypothetical protein
MSANPIKQTNGDEWKLTGLRPGKKVANCWVLVAMIIETGAFL